MLSRENCASTYRAFPELDARRDDFRLWTNARHLLSEASFSFVGESFRTPSTQLACRVTGVVAGNQRLLDHSVSRPELDRRAVGRLVDRHSRAALVLAQRVAQLGGGRHGGLGGLHLGVHRHDAPLGVAQLALGLHLLRVGLGLLEQVVARVEHEVEVGRLRRLDGPGREEPSEDGQLGRPPGLVAGAQRALVVGRDRRVAAPRRRRILEEQMLAGGHVARLQLRTRLDRGVRDLDELPGGEVEHLGTREVRSPVAAGSEGRDRDVVGRHGYTLHIPMPMTARESVDPSGSVGADSRSAFLSRLPSNG